VVDNRWHVDADMCTLQCEVEQGEALAVARSQVSPMATWIFCVYIWAEPVGSMGLGIGVTLWLALIYGPFLSQYQGMLSVTLYDSESPYLVRASSKMFYISYPKG